MEENDKISIRCKSDANPIPQVNLEKKISHRKWKDLPIKQSLKISRDYITRFVFHIYGFSKNNSGTYKRTAINDVTPIRTMSTARDLFIQSEFLQKHC